MPYYVYLQMQNKNAKIFIKYSYFLNVMFQLFFLLFHPNLKIPHLRQTIHKIYACHQ